MGLRKGRRKKGRRSIERMETKIDGRRLMEIAKGEKGGDGWKGEEYRQKDWEDWLAGKQG